MFKYSPHVPSIFDAKFYKGVFSHKVESAEAVDVLGSGQVLPVAQFVRAGGRIEREGAL
jgi:hypothetical protein